MNPPIGPGSVRTATAALFRRYLALLGDEPLAEGDETSPANLAWMCREALAGAETLPVDKLSRWLGFVQGVLAARAIISVADEREVSRPLFHSAYRTEGTAMPPTLERSMVHT